MEVSLHRHHPRILKTPVAVHNSSIPTISLPIGSTEATATVPDYGGPRREKQRQLLLTGGFNQHFLDVGKYASKVMFFILRNIPEPLYNGLVKLRMPKVLTISLPQDLWQENQYWSSRILMSRLQADSGKSKQGTSRNTSPQTNVKLNLRTDHLRADTLLGWSMTSSKFVANMEPSWTSEIHPKFHDRTTTFKHATQSGTERYQQSLTDLLTPSGRICTRCKLKNSEELNDLLQVYAHKTTFGDNKYDDWLFEQKIKDSHFKREIETRTDLQ